MPIKLNGATNGSVELDVPAAVGSDLQITLPATAGEAIVKAADGSVDLGSVDIDSSGRLLVGTSSAIGSAHLAVKGNTSDGGILALASVYTASIGGAGSYAGQIKFTDSAGGVFGNISCQADAANGANDYPGRLVFSTTADGASSPTERMRITNAGNVLIKDSTGADNITLRHDGTNGSIENYGGEFLLYAQGSQNMIFHTNGSERMRVTSTGRVSIGSTTNSAKLSIWENASSNEPVRINDTNNTNSHTHRISFRTGDVEAGKITSNRTSTNYVTSSDHRLKENVIDIIDGITRVKQLQPKRFNFIADADTTVDGFLAHEAQAIVPEAVTGEKDGEEMQGIDQSKLVPLLTAALQEAIAKIETLETQNTAQQTQIDDLLARITTLEAS